MTNSTTNPLAKNADSQGDLWVEVTIPLYVLTAAIVALRVWWRRKIAGKITGSDIAIVVSLVSSNPPLPTYKLTDRLVMCINSRDSGLYW
jgi:hypothetical protein